MNSIIKKNRFGGMTPRLHGHTKIIFTDKFGRETVKLDKDNLVTDAIQKIFESNYFGSIDYSLLMPAIRKVLGGVVLFEQPLGSDASDIWIPKSFDNAITAHAGQTVPQSLADDITRGLPNSAASVPLVNGYKMVWNFPETQGNGNIAAVGLCHSDFGDYALKSSDFKPLEMISNDSVKSFNWGADDEREKIINIFDKVNGCTYTLVIPDPSVGLNGQLFTNEYNAIKLIKRKNTLLNNIAVDMSHFFGNTDNEVTCTLTYDIGSAGTLSNCPISSLFIDETNNLLFITFAKGVASVGGYTSGRAAAYDITKFIEGATVAPEFYLSGSTVNGAVMGSNYPTQGTISKTADGYIPAFIYDSVRLHNKLTLATYDDSTKEFALEAINPIGDAGDFGGLDERFPELIALGNYIYAHGYRDVTFSNLFEFDLDNGQKNKYAVQPPTNFITPFYIEDNNPIIGATCWGYTAARGFILGNSGTALNKLYLATKNDLPATITKTAANSMRVEYSLTYA